MKKKIVTALMTVLLLAFFVGSFSLLGCSATQKGPTVTKSVTESTVDILNVEIDGIETRLMIFNKGDGEIWISCYSCICCRS